MIEEDRVVYFTQYPEASEQDYLNWILNVYAEDERIMNDPIVITGSAHRLRDYIEELEERIV